MKKRQIIIVVDNLQFCAVLRLFSSFSHLVCTQLPNNPTRAHNHNGGDCHKRGGIMHHHQLQIQSSGRHAAALV